MHDKTIVIKNEEILTKRQHYFTCPQFIFILKNLYAKNKINRYDYKEAIRRSKCKQRQKEKIRKKVYFYLSHNISKTTKAEQRTFSKKFIGVNTNFGLMWGNPKVKFFRRLYATNATNATNATAEIIPQISEYDNRIKKEILQQATKEINNRIEKQQAELNNYISISINPEYAINQ